MRRPSLGLVRYLYGIPAWNHFRNALRLNPELNESLYGQLELLKRQMNQCPILFAESTGSFPDNFYSFRGSHSCSMAKSI